ncbi:putative F-box protein PP2-B12 [Salvia divinorum]|uniref:F-box protein PP2-B12 n=1 Tax=Salvia divinorum TaxID=28513 RepID=A0ABD1GW28_SALDI
MSKHYDNWERLVVAVLRRQHDREIAQRRSTNSSAFSSRSSSFNCEFYDQLHGAIIKYSNNQNFPFSSSSTVSNSLASDKQGGEITTERKKKFPQLKRQQTTPASWQRPSSGSKSRFLNPSRSKNTYMNYAPPSRPSWCKQSYLEDERNAKKSYMVGAKDVIITFGNDSGNWEWRFDDDDFREVAELRSSWTLDVGAKMGAGLLKARSVYAAYLVYKLTETAEGLESAKGIIRFVDDKSDMEDVGERVVHLHPAGAERGEGWMEVEIGFFYVGRDDGAVEARLLDSKGLKCGLIVQGIAFRPCSAYTGTPLLSSKFKSTQVWA